MNTAQLLAILPIYTQPDASPEEEAVATVIHAVIHLGCRGLALELAADALARLHAEREARGVSHVEIMLAEQFLTACWAVYQQPTAGVAP